MWRTARLAVLLSFVVVGAVAGAGCSNILGLGDIREAPCVGDCDGGSDATSSEAAVMDATDAGDSSCAPVAVEDAGALEGASCVIPEAGPEAGTCTPQPFDASVPFVPPHLLPNACTPTQVQAFLDACLGPSSSFAACDAFQHGMQTAGCYGCIVSKSTDTTYGAIIVRYFQGQAGFSTLNAAGCIYALDRCNEPCARAVELLVQCQLDSCGAACSSPAELTACVQQTKSCPCAAYLQAASDCGGEIYKSKAPSYPCVAAADYASQVKVAALAICSTGP
jgi:hypothetical protein